MLEIELIRNFCVIAHIDHGKSTLADRFLELTHTIARRQMKNQLLDQMEIERERGITIKLQPVRMFYQGQSGQKYQLNLIDTPGHVDFSYEVSRTLAAVEGAILLVDATQGIEAQTLSHLYLALAEDLVIIPVINKIDLPNANVEKVKNEIRKLLGVETEKITAVSAKTGENVESVLEEIIKKVPPPSGRLNSDLRSLIFDSEYDEYRGVVAYVRVVDGEIKSGDKISFFETKKTTEVLEVGTFTPEYKKQEILTAGMIGYVVTGLKEISHCRVGDTIIHASAKNIKPLPGYQVVKPMVYAGLYAQDAAEYPKLREAVEKLRLNDAAFTFEPENIPALGFGFRAGFLGLLHLEIVQERLRREYGVNLVVTAPGVAYRLKTINQQEMVILRSTQELPDPDQIERIEEPWLKVDIVSPSEYIGSVMHLVEEQHGEYKSMEYLDIARVVIRYEMPLASVIVDFYDKLKSATRGYASLNYEFIDYRQADLVKLDMVISGEKVESLATIVRRSAAYQQGRLAVENLRKILPRQLFEIKIQAAIGGKIIAASRLAAMRKDVTAKLYGGDVTRKKKLLEKQKKGKKRMRASGRVEIPAEAYLSLLKKQ